MLAALQGMGFTVRSSQAGYIQASRGSGWRPGAPPAERPVKVGVAVMGHDDRSRVHVHMAEAARIGSAQVTPAAYEPVFRSVQDQLDNWLRAVDGSLETGEAAAVEFHPESPSWMRGRWNDLSKRVPGLRPAGQPVEPDLHVVTPDEVAVLTANEAQMCLAVASMITAEPGALPTPLAARLETLTVALRDALTEHPLTDRIDVAPPDVKAVEFLYQQANIRAGLPVREVRRCRDCRLERIVNPDYRSRARKSQAIRDVVGMAGVVLGPSGVQLFVVAGRLLNLDLLKPQQSPCARCEGTDWDVSLATICPQCGAITRDVVLRRCGTAGCGYDFLSRASGGSPWRPSPRAAVPGALAGLAGAMRAAAGPTTTPTAALVGFTPAPPMPVEASRPAGLPPPGWYPDPTGRHEVRWFESDWTDWAADAGVSVTDPIQ